MPPPPSSLASAITLSVVGLWSKAFLALTTKSFEVQGRHHLIDALKGEFRGSVKGKEKELAVGDGLPRRGIVTVCNHNSVVDDPMMWSLLPLSHWFPFARPSFTCNNLRWTLGASDIMFTNPALSTFFRNGQVIETVRGGGIYQPAVDTAIERLQEGGWVHIFPEGKVNQPKPNPVGGLHRFKWGVGRIIMDSPLMPEVIPIWISGFDQIMDEKRGAPRFLPRPGAKISITVGAPITSRIQALVDGYRDGMEHGTGEHDPRPTRIRVVEELQDAVRALGAQVEEAEGRFERGEWSQSLARRIESP